MDIKSNGKKAKIAIIDDEKGLVELLKEFLEGRDFLVNVAYDGRSGLELIRREKPDLVILDVVMPNMDGRDVLIELKKNKDTKDIPVIMLTVRYELFERDYGLELGADLYIPKPYDAGLLLGHIIVLLDKKKDKSRSSKNS